MEAQFFEGTAKDIQQFIEISIKTYRETFEADNNPADFESYLSSAFSHAQLSALLEDPRYHVWFLHDTSLGELAGYFALRDYPPRYSVISGVHPIEIERFYIDSQAQGSGFGKQMMAFCLEQAKALGADYAWLGVWERNEKALRFYKKLGFTIVGQHDFWVGTDCQNDFLMQKQL